MPGSAPIILSLPLSGQLHRKSYKERARNKLGRRMLLGGTTIESVGNDPMYPVKLTNFTIR